MKKEESVIEIEFPRATMKRLCEPGNFFGDCRDKNEILAPESSYFVRKSPGSNSWSIIQKIGGESITLGSKSFDVPITAPIIDLFLSIKKCETVNALLLRDTEPLTLSEKKSRACHHVGMHEWS